MKVYIFLGFLAVAAAYPGLIHEEIPEHHALIGESEHHHQVQHEHAKSHQSIKFEHFHPVPVYVKKEHSHLLKHPLEKGHTEQKLKQIHPETEHHHGHGLVLEDHRLSTEQLAHELSSQLGGHGLGGFEHGGLEHGGLEQGGAELGGYEHLQGGYEASEGLKSYAEYQPESHGAYYEAKGLSSDDGEGYKYGAY